MRRRAMGAVAGALLVSGLTTVAPPHAHAADGPNLVQNPSLEAQTGGVPTCFERVGWGTAAGTYSTVADAHSGTRSERVVRSATGTGDRKTMQLETAACAPAVTVGHQYQASVWYKSTTNNNALTIFKRSSVDGTWSWWTDLAVLPATTTYKQATALTPVIPAGVDRIVFGVSIYAGGTLTTDDYALVDTNPAPVPTTCTATAAVCENGRWNVLTYPAPVSSVHSVLLHDGKVLMIAGSGNDPAAFAAGTFKTTLYDPVAGTFTDVPTPADLFCSGHVQLADGNVLVMGGNKEYPDAAGTHGYEGLRNSYVYDVAARAYRRVNDMKAGHWYPSATVMGNGDVVTLGGLGEDSSGTVVAERFSSATGRWLDAVPQTWNFWGLYPSMVLMQDGRLFYTGSHTFGNQGYGGPGGAAVFDFASGTITDVGGLQNIQERDQSVSVLLPPAQDQKVITMGGGNVETNVDANRSTDVVDLLAADPHYQHGPALPQGKTAPGSRSTVNITDPGVVDQAPGQGKLYLSAVLLPDRTVLETGGAMHNRADAVFESSLYDPVSNTFDPVAPDPIGHGYHSQSFLLPDGRVLSMGSNGADGKFDRRMSIYSPPYLFSATRPALTDVPSRTWAYGTAQRITTSEPVVSAQLIKPAAVTHSSDPNQRLVDLPITRQADGSTSVNLTSNPNMAPPGYYMLSVIRADGVPSTSVWVKVGP